MPATPLPFSHTGRPPDDITDSLELAADLAPPDDNSSNFEIPGIQLDLTELSLAPRDKLLTVHAQLNGVPVVALLDSGAQGCFISRKTANRLNADELQRLKVPIRIRSATGNIESCDEMCNDAILTFGEHVSVVETIVAPISHDLILGKTWLHDTNPNIDWKRMTIRFTEPRTDSTTGVDSEDLLICELLSAKQFDRILRKEDSPSFMLLLDKVDTEPFSYSRECLNLDIASEFPEVFPTELPKCLPPERSVDHHIDLLPGSKPFARAPYRLSKFEADEVEKVVHDLLTQGLIRPSTSPWAAPVLFAPKKDGKLRFCVDYRVLNKQTVRNYFPIPHTDVLIDKTRGSKVFSLIDLWSAYHQIRVHNPDIPKTAFVTPLGHFEYLVVPFGLSNAPSTFQTLMNSLLGPLPFVSVYLDDILIFSQTKEEHTEHLRKVLRILSEHKLHAKSSKCFFFQESVEFLGHVLDANGVQPAPGKLQAIRDWPVPTNLRNLQSFLGFVNYYRRFIPLFAKVAQPLNALMKKEVPFNWTPDCQNAFDSLRNCLINGSAVKHFDPELPTRVETDSSGQALGAVLSQHHPDGWRPVAFLSRTMTAPERNYPIQEQELLALIYALKKWRHFLFGTSITAYRSLFARHLGNQS